MPDSYYVEERHCKAPQELTEFIDGWSKVPTSIQKQVLEQDGLPCNGSFVPGPDCWYVHQELGSFRCCYLDFKSELRPEDGS